jgi:hypothetical protein
MGLTLSKGKFKASEKKEGKLDVGNFYRDLNEGTIYDSFDLCTSSQA